MVILNFQSFSFQPYDVGKKSKCAPPSVRQLFGFLYVSVAGTDFWFYNHVDSRVKVKDRVRVRGSSQSGKARAWHAFPNPIVWALIFT
jgi:hypothetical protein